MLSDSHATRRRVRPGRESREHDYLSVLTGTKVTFLDTHLFCQFGPIGGNYVVNSGGNTILYTASTSNTAVRTTITATSSSSGLG